MLRAALILYAFVLLSLSACAPVILGRTPTPVAVGETETSVAFGLPVDLTQITVCEGSTQQDDCFSEYIGPDYWPLPTPLSLTFARGTTEDQEFNITAQLVPYPSALLPGVRLGGKDLLIKGPVLLAGDYGASLYLSNLGLDAGLLGSVPFAGGELYSALRGFGSLNWSGFPNVAASLTLGGAVSVSDENQILLELTLLANSYNGVGPQEGVQPVGFSLIPAIGFAF